MKNLPGIVKDQADLLSATKRDGYKDLIGYTVNDQNQGSYSPLDVKILNKGMEAEFDCQTAFLNPLLMQVCTRF
jgi:hypothetical protein